MTKKITIGIFSILIISVLYYLISPLFIKIRIDDEFPVITENQQVSDNNEEVIDTELDKQNQEINTDTTLVSKSFTVVGTSGHPASGKVRIISADNETVLRYEDYKTINGPDLFVYLSNDLEANDFVNIGELRGTEGNINYTVPNDVDIKDYKYVLTWCKQFGVLFNYAQISS